MSDMDERYMNQSILRALEILELFSKENSLLGLRELSEGTGLHKSTVHRLVSTLASRGWLIRNAEGKYRPGIRLLTIAQLINENITSVTEVRPILKKLAEITGELTLLSMWDGENVICVDKVDSRSQQSLQVTSAIGRTHPLHAGATGLAVLVGMPEDLAHRILEGRSLKAYTERTRTSPDHVMELYSRLKKQGYVVSAGQVDPGVTGIAMPLWFPYEKAYGSIGVTIPESRMSDTELERILTALQEAVKQIQISIGT